jgi:hypothetical protein
MEQTRNSRGNFLVIVALVAAIGSAGLATINLLKLNAFTENETLNETISQQLARDANLRNQLARSSEMAEATRQVLSESIMQDEDLRAALIAHTLESRELESLIADQSEAALQAFKASDAFEKAIRSAAKSESDSADPVDELKRSLARYERQLATLAKEVKDDESAEAVNAMQGQLVMLERSIAGLSDQVACAVALGGNSPRTFLLKSNESTVLPGFDLVISLSRLKDELIETVSVSAQEGALNQAHTQVIGNVRLGKPFDIAHGNTQYQGVFTFAQSRLFSKAFVGFEIRMASVDGESCLPASAALTSR